MGRKERLGTMKHNGPCSARRAYSLKEYGDIEYQCKNQSQCRCNCHKEGAMMSKSFSHEFDNGDRCYDPNPIIWVNGDDCLHDDERQEELDNLLTDEEFMSRYGKGND